MSAAAALQAAYASKRLAYRAKAIEWQAITDVQNAARAARQAEEAGIRGDEDEGGPEPENQLKLPGFD